MDYARGGWDNTDYPRTKVERALAGGAVGGLIGLVFGPLGTLVCTVIGAGFGYATAFLIVAARAPR